MAGHIPDAANAVHGVDGMEQIRKVHAHALAIGVHVLPQERDLRDPPVSEAADLGDHLAQLSGPFPAPHIGHDAIGAEVVAPKGDVDEGRERIGPVGRQPFTDGEALLLREDQPFPVQSAEHQLRQPPQHVGAENEIDEGKPAHDLP